MMWTDKNTTGRKLSQQLVKAGELQVARQADSLTVKMEHSNEAVFVVAALVLLSRLTLQKLHFEVSGNESVMIADKADGQPDIFGDSEQALNFRRR